MSTALDIDDGHVVELVVGHCDNSGKKERGTVRSNIESWKTEETMHALMTDTNTIMIPSIPHLKSGGEKLQLVHIPAW